MSSSPSEQQHQIAEYRILALYRFLPLVSPNPSNITEDEQKSWDEQTLMKHPERHPQLLQLQSELYATLRRYETRGTLLIAPEGINGTICYPYPAPTAHHDNADIGAGGADVTKFDGEDDPVKAFISNHPLFGGEGLRTRSSVWQEHSTRHNVDDNNKISSSNDSFCSTSSRPQQAFQRLKIKIKPEIVTLGLGRPITNTTTHTPTPTPHRHAQNQLANPNITKGQYLNPRQWDKAMKDPNVLVIDTRNSYEIDIGSFESAVDPRTKHFSEFPDYLERLANEYDWDGTDAPNNAGEKRVEQQQQQQVNGNGNKKEQPSKKKPAPTAIAMFCTGGIRCEKATSYALQSNLFPSNLPIYHLEGGILSYLDDVAKRDSATKEGTGEDGENRSTFHGECFVFDKRVALTEGLEPSNKYVSCHGCRGPMDRRLLEQVHINNGGGATKDEVDTACNVNDDMQERKRQKKEEYQQLLMGIRNLPPLTYDNTSQRWYVPGLTCPRCHDGTTRESFERFAQRKEQMEICAREGKAHFQDNGRKL